MKVNYADFIYTPANFLEKDWVKLPTRDAYGRALEEVGGQNSDIVVLDADLSGSTRTNWFAGKYPERFFNVGIAEQNMIGMAAGFALSGKIPFASSFAIFLTGRAWEPIRQSICYPNLNVKLVASHAGLTVGEDGASHQSLEDIALMRALPNMRVWIPADLIQAKAMVQTAITINGPQYIRTARPASPRIFKDGYKFDPLNIEMLVEGEDVVIITTGLLIPEALLACDLLAQKGIFPSLVNIPVIKPIPIEPLQKLAQSHRAMVSFEEHSIYGGLGSAVAEALAPTRCIPLYINGTQGFGKSGSPEELLKKFEMDSASIVAKVEKVYQNLD